MSQLRRKPNLSDESLPHDVVFDILTRLPVKSLIRFRCVSKSWYSTITNPIFITTHLNHNLNQPKSLVSNTHDNNNSHNGFLLYKSSDQELCTLVYNSDGTFTEVSRFQIPFLTSSVVDYCNGMFFLYSFFGPTNAVYLWNPVIQKFKMIDVMHFRPFTVEFLETVAFGFAYQSQNSDFKILRIVSYEGLSDEKAPPPDAEVYTLSTDSWRTVELSEESVPNIGSIFAVLPNSCVFLNGALHFVAYTWGNDDDNFILSFDVNDEIFREIRLPENYLDEFYSKFDDHVHQLVVFKGMLALVVLGPAENVDEDDDEINTDICLIWVMREYGIVESWTKTKVLFDLVMTFFDCTNSGEFLIQTFDSRLVSIDSESLQENNLRIQTTPWLAYTADLVENLVLLDQVKMSSKYHD